jgi:WhiB family redox-sensing transcriptional regulator
MNAAVHFLSLARIMSRTEPDRAEDWRESAVCASTDPALFFPDKGGATKAAKAVCSGCDVRPECLAFALDNFMDGLWGGTTPSERRRIRIARAAAEVAS